MYTNSSRKILCVAMTVLVQHGSYVMPGKGAIVEKDTEISFYAMRELTLQLFSTATV
jgi:hypothetical protein